MNHDFNLNRKITLPLIITLLLGLSFSNCKKEDPWGEYADMSPDVWAPQSLTIADVSISEKMMVWVYQLTNIEGFRLDRKVGGDAWEIGYREFPRELRTWNDSDIKPDTTLSYQYRIYAYAGDYVSDCDEVSSEIVFPPPAVLTIEKITEKKAKLSWMDLTTGEQGFKIDHKVNDGPWEIAYGTVPENQTSFTDTNVFRNAIVHYRVYAYYESYNSAKIEDTTSAALAPPTNLQLTLTSVSSVSLQWQDNSDGEDDFLVERKYAIGNWEQIASVSTNKYDDTDMDFGSEISYRVCAHAGQYCSSYIENSVEAEISPPTNFQIVSSTVTSANLSWQDNSIIEVGYRIERKYDDGVWEQIGTTANNNYLDSDFELNTQVYYRLSAYAGEYSSAYIENNFDSNIQPPDNLQIIRSSMTTVDLSWQHSLRGEDGFVIERNFENTSWEELATTTSTNFEDNSFDLNAQVYYRIAAYVGTQESTYVFDNFNSSIPPVDNLEIDINSNTSVTIDWSYGVTGHDGFKIDRKVNEGSWENEYAILPSNQSSFTDNGLDLNNNVYSYRVYVYYGSYNSLKAVSLVSMMCGYPFTDNRDGNMYETVLIDEQCWMKENLAYLPSVSPPWNWSETNPYYYVYGYNGTNVSNAKNTAEYETYGVLYNFPAAEISCPQGWHLSTTQEWVDLKNFVAGGFYIAGGKLKETGTSHWHYPNTAATNVVDFTALPGGFANVWDSEFSQKSYFGLFWAFSQYGYHTRYRMDYDDDDLKYFTGDEMNGVSVRCVRDE